MVVKFMCRILPFHPVSLILYDLRVTGRLTAAMRRGRDVIPVCTDQLASTAVCVVDYGTDTQYTVPVPFVVLVHIQLVVVL